MVSLSTIYQVVSRIDMFVTGSLKESIKSCSGTILPEIMFVLISNDLATSSCLPLLALALRAFRLNKVVSFINVS